MDETIVRVRWNGQLYDVSVAEDGTLGDLKGALREQTGVKENRQKLIGLGLKLEDSKPLKEFKIGKTIMLVGSLEEDIEKVLSTEEDGSGITVIDDFDVDYDDPGDKESSNRFVLQDTESVRQKLNTRVEDVKITLINECRPGKRLLVLDVDYTIYDHKSMAAEISELIRPGLHAFLEKVYEHYDICIWSQSKWRWLEAKITSIGLLTNDNYKLSFVLDRTSMLPVVSKDRKSGRQREHEKLPQYNEKNTVHVDDLSRNFALNPKNGIKVAPFKNAPVWRHYDKELEFVGEYLVHLATTASDFSKTNHRDWKSVVGRLNPSLHR